MRRRSTGCHASHSLMADLGYRPEACLRGQPSLTAEKYGVLTLRCTRGSIWRATVLWLLDKAEEWSVYDCLQSRWQKPKPKSVVIFERCMLTLHSGFSWSLSFSRNPSTFDLSRVTLKFKSPNQNTRSKLAVKSSSKMKQNRSVLMY